jgi:hypothetical protein
MLTKEHDLVECYLAPDTAACAGDDNDLVLDCFTHTAIFLLVELDSGGLDDGAPLLDFASEVASKLGR